MADQHSATESWLRRDMESILRRLVQRREFAEEIERLALHRYLVVLQVPEDPIVLASARRAYAPLEKGRRALAAHKAQTPEPLLEGWSPTPAQDRAVLAAACVSAGWVLAWAVFRSWMPAIVELIGLLMAIGITWALAWYGLPKTAGDWCRWGRDHLWLMAGLPTKWWDQRQYLKEEVLIPELREWLHRQTTPSFDLELELRDASGLTMPPGHGPLVRTAAVEACAREVNRSMPGAVGLAGTRGAGKSTIVERAVCDEFTHHSRGPMLGVLTSAPVRYDARDFVLHIHSRVCREVLDFLAGPRESAGSETQREWHRLHRVRRLSASLADMGRGLVRAVVLLGLATGAAALTWQHAVALLCTFLVAAALVTLVRRLVWRMGKGSAILLWQMIRARTAHARSDPKHAALRKVAEQHLRRIRFLQTHTEGWSGKVSGPAGTDLGLSRSLARTEQPWTHPEVVARLRDFLELVVDVLGAKPTRLSGVVVGIDELDKISDPEDAHRFLNEIKGIFGVKQCLFLVSVSDDALTAFERRGMPARDAFDSAFTTVIDVRAFTPAQSETWLAQRALGIPLPFVWLCHCLSGGLPRDLGRVAIALHDLDDKCSRLSEVTQALVRNDLNVKVRAFGHSAGQMSRTDEDEPAPPHALISDLQGVINTELDELEELALRIWPTPERTPRTELESLRAEAACYLVFCQTLVEVFHDELDPTALLHLDMSTSAGPGEEPSGVVMLARVRQYMAVNTTLARNTLVDFRARLDAVM